MKVLTTASLLFVFSFLFQGLASAWDLPSFQVPLISSWLGSSTSTSSVTSRVPQFVLDTGHSWFTIHAHELSSLPDVTSFIYTISADDAYSQDSVTDGDESANVREGIEVPADLFHRLEINNHRAGVSRYGWMNVHNKLEEIKACPRALAEVRDLTVELTLQTLGDTWDHPAAKSTPPPKPVPASFSEVMGNMKSLSTIDWLIRGADENAAIGKAFIEDGTRLTGVKHLVTSMNAPWLVDACPSLTSLEAKRDRFVWGEDAYVRDEAWFAAARRAKGLRKLDMGNVDWMDTMTGCDLFLPLVHPSSLNGRFFMFC
ncbi:hypothetical protein CSAL01_10042 [Colletotrichum salicis]|uniref:Uncharacterized protein n=1 Tax=Colletotrichum salicis TaxID=1209931 RepID=A0A135U2B9_9PEZI|nr:hypothetical protein CSAL01_10042 [Colletotrichum salicis]